MAPRRAALLAVALLACSRADAPAAEPKADAKGGCVGTIEGAVKGTFRCRSAVQAKDGGVRITLMPEVLPEGVSAFLGGPIDVAGPLEAKKPYTIQQVKAGRVMLSSAQHASYIAEPGQPARGELALQLDGIPPPGHESVATSGTLRVRLVPLDDKASGDVVVTLRF